MKHTSCVHCSNIPCTYDKCFVQKMVGWSYYDGTSFNIFEGFLVLQRYNKLASVQLGTGMLVGITALKDNVNGSESGLLPQAYNIRMHLARLVYIKCESHRLIIYDRHGSAWQPLCNIVISALTVILVSSSI
jgi:hypothetical protein